MARRRLWFAIVAGVALFSLFIIIQDVPERLQREALGQQAMRLLDGLRQPLFQIKAAGVESRGNENPAQVASRFEQAADNTELLLVAYRKAVAYNPELAAGVDRFIASYRSWIGAERDLLDHLSQSNDQHSTRYTRHLVHTNKLFLTTMSELGKGEAPLHHDIHEGHQALYLMQWFSALLLVYLFVIIITYQSVMTRTVVAGERDLDATVKEDALRLQRIMDSAMDAVIVVDKNSCILEWNPQAEVMFGWSRDEAVGSYLHDTIIPRELQEAHRQGLERLVTTGERGELGQRLEVTALHRSGRQFPVELTVAQLQQSQDCLFSAFIRDLTEKKQAEEALHKQHAQLNEAQRIARLGYWELDLKNNRLEWSDEIYRIFELDQQNFKPSYEAFIKAVHPDDRDNVSCVYSKSVENKTGYDIVYRLLMNGDSIKYVRDRCETSYDEQGVALRSFGTVQDITDSTIAEQELQLAATTFNSHAGILITDKSGNILRVNPAFEAMTGYSASELVGQNPRILRSRRQDEAFYSSMWSILAETGRWSGELWNQRKDGHLYAEMLTITAVSNEAGEITHYVGTTQDITERKRAEARIEHLAYYDDLTKLANRRLLRDRLQQEIAVARRRGVYGALLFIDLDQFKHLNDSLGHPVGDELLRQVAKRLKDMVRAEDTVARLGGDEFVLILPAEDKDLSRVSFEAQAVAEKIRVHLAESYDLNGHQYHINASTGIVLFPESDEDADDVLKHADSALYRAKEDGRNTVRFYQPSMQAAADSRLSLEKDLRDALEHGGFQLHYQPQVDNEGRITGAEALIRWPHPQRGMVSPNLFIPVAEETGLILEIGSWVLRTAVQQIYEWRRNSGIEQLCRLAVNVSPREFHQGGFVDQVLGICEEVGVPPDCIELEITESLVMNKISDTIEKMDKLRSRGVRFAIDDFGTGYSSLSYLKRLPLDLVKIDQSFVRDIVSDPNDAAIVDTIIAMTSHLGLGVIAEGVETVEQLEFLKERGCTSFQGYYYSLPVPAEELERLLCARNLPLANG